MPRPLAHDGKHKICRRCKTKKPLSAFHLHRYTVKSGDVRVGVQTNCKKCANEISLEHFVANREKKLKYQRELTAWWRAVALAGYGGECKCCGEVEQDFLCIDHVNNDGAQHRKEITPGVSLYRLVIRLGFPERFRLLCFNCNNAKQQRGTCPHQRKKLELVS